MELSRQFKKPHEQKIVSQWVMFLSWMWFHRKQGISIRKQESKAFLLFWQKLLSFSLSISPSLPLFLSLSLSLSLSFPPSFIPSLFRCSLSYCWGRKDWKVAVTIFQRERESTKFFFNVSFATEDLYSS